MLIIYLLNVLSVFAGIAILIAFLHAFAAMKRCFGYGVMAGLPIFAGMAYAFLTADGGTFLATLGQGALCALAIMVVMSFVGVVLLKSKITASEAENGYRGLGPVLIAALGCAVYILAILGVNAASLGQMNFWTDAADLSKHGLHAEDGGH